GRDIVPKELEPFLDQISFFYRNWDMLTDDYHKDLKKIYYKVLEDDDSERLELIIKEGFGADFSFRPREYLGFARHSSTITTLRQFGVGQYDLSALHIAIALFSPDRSTNRCLELLLRYKAEIEVDSAMPDRMDPLYMTYKTGNIEGMTLLFQYGATACDEIFMDVIHKPPDENRLELLKLLFQNSDATCINKPFYRSNCIMYLAALDRFEKIGYLELLISLGADVNATNAVGYTPIFAAANMGNLSGFEFLRKHGCHVNIETRDRCNPLHLAYRNAMTKCVPTLIEIVDDINKIDAANHTPLDYAMICGPVYNEMETSGMFFQKLKSDKYIKLMLNNGAVLNKFDESDLKAFLKRSPNNMPLLCLLFNSFPNWRFLGFREYPEALVNWHPDVHQQVLDVGDMPRSLKHHCRHCLRVAMGRQYQNVVKSANLPQRIEEYLLFDDPTNLT
ncbi:ankyrin repeat domain-containing protein 61-like, partial [Glandiceps talaboti]